MHTLEAGVLHPCLSSRRPNVEHNLHTDRQHLCREEEGKMSHEEKQFRQKEQSAVTAKYLMQEPTWGV